MKCKKLAISLQQENLKLATTVDSLSKTVDKLTQEVEALKQALLEKSKEADKMKRFAEVHLPKKNEKTKYTKPVSKDKTPAPTPKERGNKSHHFSNYIPQHTTNNTQEITFNL